MNELLLTSTPCCTMKNTFDETSKIIAIGGGKGGVGKTLFAVALGLSLINRNKKTILIDTDFGSPSLNTFLNINTPKRSLKDLLLGKCHDINEIVEETAYPNLGFISGAAGILGMPEFCATKRTILADQFRRLQADYVIMDLGSGNTPEAITLFCAADEGIVVTNPDPMAVQETFGFLKSCQFQRLQNYFKNYPKIVEFIKTTFETYNYKKYKALRKMLQKNNLFKGKKRDQHFQPKLILNMVTNERDSLDGYALQLVSEDLLGVQLHYWGDIYFDENIRHAVKQTKLMQLVNIEKISEASARLVDNGHARGLWHRKAHRARQFDYYNSDDIICSVKCSLWDNCSFQRGGYPCKIKYIGFISSQ